MRLGVTTALLIISVQKSDKSESEIRVYTHIWPLKSVFGHCYIEKSEYLKISHGLKMKFLGMTIIIVGSTTVLLKCIVLLLSLGCLEECSKC